MRTMTCTQLGGACEKTFTAKTFEEIAEMSKKHGMEMFQQADEAHTQAFMAMQQKMNDPQAMQAWTEQKKKEFEAIPEYN